MSGATGVLARTPVPPSTVKEKVGPRKAGAVEKRQGRMPGHLALNSSRNSVPSRRLPDSSKILPVESKNGFVHWPGGRWPSPTGNVAEYLTSIPWIIMTVGMRSHLINKLNLNTKNS